MKSKIYLKGLNEPFYVPYYEAKRLNEAFENKEVPDSEILGFGHKTFRKSAIRFIDLNEDKKSIVENGKLSEHLTEHRKVKVEFLNSPLDFKSNNLKFFGLLYCSCTNGLSPDLLTEEKARGIQRQFFVDNPKRMYCDPVLFKNIIPNTVVNKTYDIGLRFCERVVNEDIINQDFY